MLQTTHYSLNLVEGTDVVNPLVQQNPNYSAIDTAMFANKQASIGTGTELTSGTVHTITRLNPDSNYVRFTATSNWTAGDTMVIDSTPVSVYLSDGTTPASGAYIINTEVLIVVNGSRVTILTSGSKDSTAAQVSYDNTSSGLAASNVQDAIDELATVEIASVTADGTKTWATLLNELYALVNLADITPTAKLAYGIDEFAYATLGYLGDHAIVFTVSYAEAAKMETHQFVLRSVGSTRINDTINTGGFTSANQSSTAVQNGTTIKIYA